MPGGHMKNRTLTALAACLAIAARLVQAAPDAPAKLPDTFTDKGAELSEPMKDAVALAGAAGGGIAFVGAGLAIDDATTPVEVAIVQPVPVERMKPGEIVMLAKVGCTAAVGCLMARRITEKRGVDVATTRYGSAGIEAHKEAVEASVVGRIAYTVDLKTGRIRDMRKDDSKTISFVEALRRESKKWHYVGFSARSHGPLKA